MTTAGPDPALRKVSPVSFAQERLWLLDRLEPGTPAYNIARAIRIRGALSTQALRDSLRAIVERHESLRTTFAEVDGQPMQIIGSVPGFELPIVDLTALDQTAGESETQRVIREEAQRPFDLTSGPLLRATLLRLRPDEHVLLEALR